MFKRILTPALVFGLVAIPPPGFSDPICGPRENVVAALSERYSEMFNGGGFQPPDKVVEIWVSPKVGTWTLLVTMANKTSCIVASGTNWITGEWPESHTFRGINITADRPETPTDHKI